MGYSPWGHKESDMTQVSVSSPANTLHTTARLQSRPHHYSEEPLQGLHAISKVQAPSCG